MLLLLPNMIPTFDSHCRKQTSIYLDPKSAETIVKLRTEFNGRLICRPPVVFEADGTKYNPEPIVTDLGTLGLTQYI